MLSPDLTTVRLFLHILGAAVWVGGQLTLAGLVPGLRAAAPDAPRVAARHFNLIAWPAFALLLVTGVWSLAAVDLADVGTAYQATVAVKLAVVAISGAAAAIHTLTSSRVVLAVAGALAALSGLAALFVGVLLSS
ncbi:MAG: hypothetical protein IPM45_01740 [Acidimicrobiales bacterium]|nr:hypothetical protein [Acidimicrobiales bacterium]